VTGVGSCQFAGFSNCSPQFSTLRHGAIVNISIVSDYRWDDRGSIPGCGKGYFPLASVSRPALRPIQWVPGVTPGGNARPRSDAYHSPLLVLRSRMNRSYILSRPCRLHGIVGQFYFDSQKPASDCFVDLISLLLMDFDKIR
jgi:hypothetical protein